jgi:hypothetical protein
MSLPAPKPQEKPKAVSGPSKTTRDLLRHPNKPIYFSVWQTFDVTSAVRIQFRARAQPGACPGLFFSWFQIYIVHPCPLFVYVLSTKFVCSRTWTLALRCSIAHLVSVVAVVLRSFNMYKLDQVIIKGIECGLACGIRIYRLEGHQMHGYLDGSMEGTI